MKFKLALFVCLFVFLSVSACSSLNDSGTPCLKENSEHVLKVAKVSAFTTQKQPDTIEVNDVYGFKLDLSSGCKCDDGKVIKAIVVEGIIIGSGKLYYPATHQDREYTITIDGLRRYNNGEYYLGNRVLHVR